MKTQIPERFKHTLIFNYNAFTDNISVIRATDSVLMGYLQDNKTSFAAIASNGLCSNSFTNIEHAICFIISKYNSKKCVVNQNQVSLF